ncbi:MAG: hypothetical protein IKX84_07915 [Clostridia bacterium]|nr:hypothetical protein [Clostridia bacterium]
MMEGVYRFADLNVAIRTRCRRLHDMCRDYRASGLPDIVISLTGADVDREREKAAVTAQREGRFAAEYPYDYLETLAAYRALAEELPGHDGFLIHGSAVAADGEGYVFIAPSGTGKSTHARLWLEMLGSRAVMINDDKPLLRFMPSGPRVYGTPWDGKEHLSANMSAPLKAVCVLTRAKENTIRPLSPHEALAYLLRQIYRPAGKEAAEQTLTLIDRLDAGLYLLGCNMEPEAARVAYEGMKG